MSWRPRVIGNESWSRDESNSGGGEVIGRQRRKRRTKNRFGGATFEMLDLRREAVERDGGTKRGVVGGWARMRGGVSGGVVAGGASGEQWQMWEFRGLPWRSRRNGGSLCNFQKL
ncbi:hypothetical protein PanWU01x14_117400 [Parasponia andersonii]|uniref:Uncharacterized protein n=1 Tax=Parasponia andersonii TaxID=3476 RepID=A0A2P5CWM6_PARAD|nr:hypothetical protein PanWU01x14_117400 [Parasponia andersonii]